MGERGRGPPPSMSGGRGQRLLAICPLLLQERPNCCIAMNCRFVPEATKCTAAKRSLFDHLVGAAKQIDREGDAERLGGLEIDDELDFRGLHDRQIARLLTLEDPTGIDANLAKRLRKARSVAHQ